MRFMTLDEIKRGAQLPAAGDQVAFKDSEGRVRKGTVRIKAVRCGREGCKKCPHKSYAYAQYRDGKKVREKYVGIVR